MEAKINNSEEQIKIRKSQSTLVIVGTGIMMFGIWTAVKSFGVALLRQAENVQEIMSDMSESVPDIKPETAFIVMLAFTALYVLIELGVRVFVGMSAIAEGLGHKKGWAYIIWTYLLVFIDLQVVLLEVAGIITIIGVQTGVFNLNVNMEDVTHTSVITALIIDLTSLVMMIQMLVSARRVRKYRKAQSLGEAGHAA